ncbi:MAG TPA: alanine racemase, partial [Acidimicrobiales bacterium]|nr:alanine racemase [Acidimicrobiales bacterium]
GVVLRDAGIDAPVLLLSEPPVAAAAEVVARGLTPSVYTLDAVAALDGAAAAAGASLPVHVKLDSGMHRVGADESMALQVASAVDRSAALVLDGVWTHFAVADDPEQDDFTAGQCRRFASLRQQLRDEGISPRLVHVANSAGALMVGAHHDLVRAGLATYGYHPNPARPTAADLHPVLSLKAQVSYVKRLAAGERVSYGLRYALPEESVVATIPLGYADGVPRRLFETGGRVLVGGRARPIAGVVTMDQLMVDCGPDADVHPGDEVVLLGEQGGERITADDWAERLGTISYEILCGIGPRVPRVYR